MPNVTKDPDLKADDDDNSDNEEIPPPLAGETSPTGSKTDIFLVTRFIKRNLTLKIVKLSFSS